MVGVSWLQYVRQIFYIGGSEVRPPIVPFNVSFLYKSEKHTLKHEVKGPTTISNRIYSIRFHHLKCSCECLQNIAAHEELNHWTEPNHDMLLRIWFAFRDIDSEHQKWHALSIWPTGVIFSTYRLMVTWVGARYPFEVLQDLVKSCRPFWNMVPTRPKHSLSS